MLGKAFREPWLRDAGTPILGFVSKPATNWAHRCRAAVTPLSHQDIPTGIRRHKRSVESRRSMCPCANIPCCRRVSGTVE
ncbi:hypothetical protein BD413DRAFT_177830 [Trametes elegans]|nr:hypothetical protein BD413DRAFT_177830 [Trametes elegans]